MTGYVDLKGCVSSQAVNKVRKICEPLFQRFPVTSFKYLKVNNNGSRIVLGTNPNLLKYIYEEGNYRFMWYDGVSDLMQRAGWRAWQFNRIIDKRKIHKKIDTYLTKVFNLSHGLTYVRRETCFFEAYSFDTDDPNVNYSNLNLLLRFIYYFKSSGKKLIEYAENEKILIPK